MKPKKVGRIRRVVQVGVLLLLIAIPLMNLLKVHVLQGTLCSLGTAGVTVSCALGALQTTLASKTLHWPLLIGAAFFVLLAAFLGRVFCSWICPQGLASEAGDAVRTRLGRNETAQADSPQRARTGRRVLLTVLVVGLVSSFLLGVPILCYVCPIGIICRNIVGATYLGVVGGELAIVGVILLAEVFVARRGWCKYLCPVGALYGLCTTPAALHLERNDSLCLGCHTCERDCPMGNSPLAGRIGPTCTNCGICLDGCPGGALRYRVGLPLAKVEACEGEGKP